MPSSNGIVVATLSEHLVNKFSTQLQTETMKTAVRDETNHIPSSKDLSHNMVCSDAKPNVS